MKDVRLSCCVPAEIINLERNATMSDKTVSYACPMPARLSDLSCGLTMERPAITPEIADTHDHQPVVAASMALQPKTGEVYSKAGAVVGLRYLKRAGRLVLQYGCDTVVFIDGKFDRNEIVWRDVPIGPSE